MKYAHFLAVYCAFMAVVFNLSAINSQGGCGSEPSLPAFRGCRIEGLHPELNVNNIINNNNVYFIL